MFFFQLIFLLVQLQTPRLHGDKRIPFTPAEELYLIDKKEFTLAVDPHWMPIESLNEKKEHIGIAADFFALISKKGGFGIKLIPTSSWTETVELAKNRTADILSFSSETEERKKFWNFTKPVLTLQTVIATKQNRSAVNSIEEILDKPIGIMRGYSHVELFRKEYPTIQIVEIDSYEQGFKKVLSDELYGVVGNVVAIGYYLQQEKINTLKIAGKVHDDIHLKIAVRNDNPQIVSIFNKVLASITDEEKQTIWNKWLSVRYEHTTDYTLYLKTLGVSLIVFGLFLFWFLKIKRLNAELLMANNQLRAANEQKNYLFSVIGHDLRNPLTPMLGFSSMLEKEAENLSSKEISYQASIIHTKSTEMLRILNQLVDWAKAELDFISIKKEPVYLKEQFEQIILLYKDVLDQKKIHLNLDVPSSVCVLSDEAMLSTILRNLVYNSIKYSHSESSIFCQISVHHEGYQLIIQDHGIGMTDEIRENVFKLTTKKQKLGTDRENGSGLGLLICKSYTDKLGIPMKIESVLNKGTTITLSFNKVED